MTFFFSWIKSSETLDEKKHFVEDVKILDFSLSHNEGEAALLRMKVTGYKPHQETQCVLIYKKNEHSPVNLLFRGSLCHFPLRLRKRLWQLEFCSVVDLKSFESSKKSLVSSANKHFLKNENLPTVSELLEPVSSLFQFDRVSGKCVLSNIFQGREKHFLKNILAKSVSVNFSELPLEAVNIILSAQWVQNAGGEVDIAPRIANSFSSHIINTFTPKAWSHQFPKVGFKLGEKRGRSGCRVVESVCEEILPPVTGVLDMYPRVSPPFLVRQGDMQDGVPMTLPRVYFASRLVVEWVYKQARRETIHLSVKNNLPSPAFRPAKTLYYEMRHLSKIQGSFFLTKVGKDALVHALDRAKSHLAASARCIEIAFQVPFEEGLSLHLDQSLNMREILHLKRDVFAKVIGYEMRCQGLKKITEVRCALSFGAEIKDPESQSYANEMTMQYVQNIEPLFDELVGKLKPRGVLNPDLFDNSVSLVKRVTLMNSPEEQLSLMQNSDDLQKVMNSSPTRFDVELQDLRTTGVLEEVVHLKTHHYAPPPLILLKELEEVH